MTIGKKFILVFAIFFVTVATGVFFFYKSTKVQESDKISISLAGRQSMLTQKYFKEYIDELIPLQVRHSTLKAAEIATLQIVEDRKQYTKNIIVKLKKDGVVDVLPNKDYAAINGGIPLPATFVQEVSEAINQKGVYSYDLLSKWNINKDKGLSTDFESETFDYLYSKKGKVFSRFMVHNGLYTLRYATPDVATAEACVSCHNNHEDSPKNDFKLGDVMGILVVNIPIGTVSAQTEAFFASSGDKELGTDSFLKTKKVFDTTIGALINGGKAPLDLEMARFTTIHPTTDPAIRTKLEEVKQLWSTTHDNLKKLLEVEPNSAEYIVAYDIAYKSTNATMKKMNEAVDMLHVVSDKKASTFLLWNLGGFLGVTSLVIGLCWMFFSRPLIKLLGEIAAKLDLSSEQFTSASGQISSTSQTLAQGASEQAAMTGENVKNVEETTKLIDKCGMFSENGNRLVQEMNNSMEEINSSNEKIAEITKVIDDIAKKTDLLAVNAAIEAANAGEHGKGFAVVAEEVRNLAQRSATAARETTDLINDCVNKTVKGAKLAEKCKDSMNEIKNATIEQTERMNQVNNATHQMDQVTQQNAANAEEMASASEELSAQAETLMYQVKLLSLQVGGAENGVLLAGRKSTRHNQTESTLPTFGKSSLNPPLGKGQIPLNPPLGKGELGGFDKGGVRKDENEDGTENVLSKTDPDALIPMGDDSVTEHDDRFKDF